LSTRPDGAPTAAIILIGDELLSGQIQDENAAWLAGRLHGLGVRLRRVEIIPDEADTIAHVVRSAAAAHDHVFTSGGVGPTHDDITVRSIAAAFGVEAVRVPALEAILRGYFRDGLTDAHLRMAEMPDGGELIDGGRVPWPVMRFRNIWLLPGVPQIFRDKFDSVADRFEAGRFVVRSVYLNADEGTIAARLEDVASAHMVKVGSYPQFGPGDHRVRVTLESVDASRVDAAVQSLVEALDDGWLVRIE
jgi:molybdenum cofactor synthesis domain-containing protein